MWIEISSSNAHCDHLASLPARGVWIEMITMTVTVTLLTSLPATGVWIEIEVKRFYTPEETLVTPREGSVD